MTYIGKQLMAEPLSRLTLALFIVTHSEYLVRELLPLEPQAVFIGKSHPSIQAWIDRPIEAVDLDEFSERCRTTYKMVLKHLKG